MTFFFVTPFFDFKETHPVLRRASSFSQTSPILYLNILLEHKGITMIHDHSFIGTSNSKV